MIAVALDRYRYGVPVPSMDHVTDNSRRLTAAAFRIETGNPARAANEPQALSLVLKSLQ